MIEKEWSNFSMAEIAGMIRSRDEKISLLANEQVRMLELIRELDKELTAVVEELRDHVSSGVHNNI